jgi:1-acyl-sn-glycerol-3-phosphate acyltransferase
MARRVVDLRSRLAREGEPTAGESPPAGTPRRRRHKRPVSGVADAAASAADALHDLGGDSPAPPDATPARRPRVRVRHDPFAERLRALEREIEETLARAGGGVDPGLLAFVRSGAEEILGLYADVVRAFLDGGVEAVFARVRMVGTADEVDDFGYDAAFHARVAPLLRFLYERWWRVEVGGSEHVPQRGRALLVANHSGGLFPYDALMVAHAVQEHRPGDGCAARPLVEDVAYHFPFAGSLLARLGIVRASAENAARLLARDQAVLVFPEGAKGPGKYYRDRYRLQRFARGGFVSLALRTGAPLIPVAVIGAEEIYPVLARWHWLARALNLPYFPVTPTFPWLGVLGLVPLPTKWRILFGPPIDLAAEYGIGAHEDELLVNRLKEAVRERIQRMIVDGLRERDSVFTG